ncbi:hypothetical protein [Catenisphaera adipataccumulans]|uniref:Foldase protein PrsA n=1 Tax=Catenisphaera adipataccumulans TaxID=700500 RepID=A0A7W8CY87_9FIRM|nr:hypothetical protein [Catenisphaera adipataccumulans]MBB5183586.1 foldase protein PrsA [Catenisphaera adipataccumulans]
MKKISILLLCGAFLLTGCSGHVTSVSDGDQELMTIGDTTITKNDEYELLKTYEGSDVMMSEVASIIYKNEIGTTKKIRKEAEQQYEEFASSSDDPEAELESKGYSSKEDYIENYLIPSIQSEKLVDKYFKDDKKTIKKKYKPSVAKILECDDKDTAEKALKELKDGKDTSEVFDEYQSDDANFSDEETLVSTQTSSVPTRLVNTLYKQKKAGVVDEVFSDSSDSDSSDSSDSSSTKYYVAILVNNDYDEIIDQVRESLSSDSDVTSACMEYYLKKYDFEVHDQEIFDYLKENNPEYLVQYPELKDSDDDSSN